MWKKIIAVIVVVGIAVGLAIWGLGGSKSLATSNAGSITEADYVSSVKQTSAGQQTMANMIIQKVLEKNYGKQVTNKAVNASYSSVESEYGSSFSAQLSSNGLTETTFRDSIRLQALERAAVKANKKFSTADLKEAYASYTPNMNVSVIEVADESTAKDLISKLDDGSDFATLAKDNSTDSETKDNGGKMPVFDSTSQTVDANVVKAATELKKGEYTKTAVKSTSGAYYIIKMNSIAEKKSFKSLKSKMEEIKLDAAMQDQSTVQGIIGQELAKADVSIKDSDLKNVLQQYSTAAAAMKTSSTSSSSSSLSSSSSSSN